MTSTNTITVKILEIVFTGSYEVRAPSVRRVQEALAGIRLAVKDSLSDGRDIDGH